jgi:hypothetical protein
VVTKPKHYKIEVPTKEEHHSSEGLSDGYEGGWH